MRRQLGPGPVGAGALMAMEAQALAFNWKRPLDSYHPWEFHCLLTHTWDPRPHQGTRYSNAPPYTFSLALNN